jgi:ATPase subunit of ABC transporter with duplicated ATPase domains
MKVSIYTIQNPKTYESHPCDNNDWGWFVDIEKFELPYQGKQVVHIANNMNNFQKQVSDKEKKEKKENKENNERINREQIVIKIKERYKSNDKGSDKEKNCNEKQPDGNNENNGNIIRQIKKTIITMITTTIITATLTYIICYAI